MAIRLQSGIESITTYGVMLLAVGIVIVIIFLLSTIPQSTIPNSCNLYGNLHCLDLAYSANTAASGSNLVVLLQLGVTGMVNVSSFEATVGGVKSTSGYCSTTGNSLGPSEVSQGAEMVCVATFPPPPPSKQTYSGTFNISANYCASVTGNSPCPMSSKYLFAGSWRAQGTNTPFSFNSLILNNTPPLSISLSPLSETIQVGQSVAFTNTTSGGVPPYSYSYSVSPSSYSISGNRVTFSAVGTYSVQESVTDSAGKTARSQTATITTTAQSLPILAYVQGGAFTRNISVINTQTMTSNTVFIDSGIGPNLDASCIAITPDQTQAYLVYAYEGIYVYNALTGTIYKIPGLHGVYTTPVLSPGSDYLYDIEPNLGSTTAYFYTISTKTNSVTDTITADTKVSNPNPIRQQISPDGSQVYIGVQSETDIAQSGAILTYNTVTDQLANIITENSWPSDIVLSQNGNTLYAILQGPSYGLFTIQSISTSTFMVTNTITLINDPSNQELERASPWLYGSTLYVALPSEGLFVVNTQADTSNQVTSLPTSNPGMSGIALSGDGSTAYITAYNYNGGGVFVFDTSSNTVTQFISDSNLGVLSGIVLTPDGKYVYVSDTNSNTITVISRATDTVTNTIGVIDNPNYIAVAGGNFTSEPS